MHSAHFAACVMRPTRRCLHAAHAASAAGPTYHLVDWMLDDTRVRGLDCIPPGRQPRRRGLSPPR